MSRRPESRRQVETMVGFGVPLTSIGKLLGISENTIRLHYREQLDVGMAKANAQVAGFLFQQAKAGNVVAQIFWLKAAPVGSPRPTEYLRAIKKSGSRLILIRDERAQKWRDAAFDGLQCATYWRWRAARTWSGLRCRTAARVWKVEAAIMQGLGAKACTRLLVGLPDSN